MKKMMMIRIFVVGAQEVSRHLFFLSFLEQKDPHALPFFPDLFIHFLSHDLSSTKTTNKSAYSATTMNNDYENLCLTTHLTNN
jgi:hypothetical protein